MECLATVGSGFKSGAHRVAHTLTRPHRIYRKESNFVYADPLSQACYLQLWYADESGFSLTPTVPYGWIMRGQQVCILSQRCSRLNVFALLSMDNQLVSYPRSTNVNTAFMVECLDEFAHHLRSRV